MCDALILCRMWDVDVYSDLCGVRDISAIFDALLEVLDPTKESVAGGVAEDIAEEDWYAGE